MMSRERFSKGDRVRCIDPRPLREGGPALERRAYTVESVHCDGDLLFLRDDGYPDQLWAHSRFRRDPGPALVSPEPEGQPCAE